MGVAIINKKIIIEEGKGQAIYFTLYLTINAVLPPEYIANKTKRISEVFGGHYIWQMKVKMELTKV